MNTPTPPQRTLAVTYIPTSKPQYAARVSDCEGYFPGSTDNTVPSTELSSPPQPPSPEPPKFRYSPSQTTTHSNDSLPTLQIAVNQHLVIASCVCILSFLLYLILCSLPDNILIFIGSCRVWGWRMGVLS